MRKKPTFYFYMHMRKCFCKHFPLPIIFRIKSYSNADTKFKRIGTIKGLVANCSLLHFIYSDSSSAILPIGTCRRALYWLIFK